MPDASPHAVEKSKDDHQYAIVPTAEPVNMAHYTVRVRVEKAGPKPGIALGIVTSEHRDFNMTEEQLHKANTLWVLGDITAGKFTTDGGLSPLHLGTVRGHAECERQFFDRDVPREAVLS
jgi:hypothetical protein